MTPKTTTRKPQNKPDFYQTQAVTRHAAVTNYASTAKPSPTPTLFGVSLAPKPAISSNSGASSPITLWGCGRNYMLEPTSAGDSSRATSVDQFPSDALSGIRKRLASLGHRRRRFAGATLFRVRPRGIELHPVTQSHGLYARKKSIGAAGRRGNFAVKQHWIAGFVAGIFCCALHYASPALAQNAIDRVTGSHATRFTSLPGRPAGK